MLEAVETLDMRKDVLTGRWLSEFVGAGVVDVPEDVFPSGFYRFSRRSFVNSAQFVVGLVFVFRDGTSTYIRSYEAPEALRQQGLSADAGNREFRGFITRQEDGIAMVISRRNAMTCSFNYLSRVASFENNFWVGYVARTVPETFSGSRAERMVYEHLGTACADVLQVARQTGLVSEDDLLPYHRRLLQPSDPFH